MFYFVLHADTCIIQSLGVDCPRAARSRGLRTNANGKLDPRNMAIMGLVVGILLLYCDQKLRKHHTEVGSLLASRALDNRELDTITFRWKQLMTLHGLKFDSAGFSHDVVSVGLV